MEGAAYSCESHTHSNSQMRIEGCQRTDKAQALSAPLKPRAPGIWESVPWKDIIRQNYFIVK
jgi:hypothetical protein